MNMVDIRLNFLTEEFVEATAFLHALLPHLVEVFGVVFTCLVVVGYPRVESGEVAFELLLAKITIIDLRADCLNFMQHSVMQGLMIELEVLAHVAKHIRRYRVRFQIDGAG